MRYVLDIHRTIETWFGPKLCDPVAISYGLRSVAARYESYKYGYAPRMYRPDRSPIRHGCKTVGLGDILKWRAISVKTVRSIPDYFKDGLDIVRPYIRSSA